jgi:hypothetical protein
MKLFGSRQNPWLWLFTYLLIELWLFLRIPESVLDLPIAKSYVEAMATVAPVVHHFDSVATRPAATSFFLALSPLLLIPKAYFWGGWLQSEKMRNYRYFIVSPRTKSVPTKALDFVTDPLRTDTENQPSATEQPISRRRAVVLSIAMLCFVSAFAYLWPFVLFGKDVAKGGDVDLRELWVAYGGWRFWLAWSVYQMNLAAGFLAVGYCILRDWASPSNKC